MTGIKNEKKGHTILHLVLVLTAITVIILLTNTGEMPVVHGIIGSDLHTPTPAATNPLVPNTPIPSMPDTGSNPHIPTDAVDTYQPFAIMSMMAGNTYQLHIYTPQTASILRLTQNPWNEINPALNPAGTHLAFSSDRNGFWDLYILEFATNLVTRITDTPQYDGAPTWSPDGKWLAFESYLDNNLEVQISSAFQVDETAIRLTHEVSSDHSPAWSPDGRSILFVSNRSGDEEIWMADLNTSKDRFTNLSNQQETADREPNWSPAGKYIAWSSERNGVTSITQMNVETGIIKQLNVGSMPHYSLDGIFITSINQAPTSILVSSSLAESGVSITVPVLLPGAVNGIAMAPGRVYNDVVKSFESITGTQPVSSADQAALPLGGGQHNDGGLIALDGIKAPYAYLHSDAVEDFWELHQQVELEVGWNFLDHLENAFIPLTQPPSPGMQDSWLYTGRAFAINSSPLSGGWMCVVREDFAGETYWRIFLKTRFQDGSQGMPIRLPVWDFSARYSGNPEGYEHGGIQNGIPEGYWVDFTEIASRFGWQRLPALQNWRTYFDGTLFNQYVHSGKHNWQSAMQDLYPQEALSTATRVPTRTLTPAVSPTAALISTSTNENSSQIAQPTATYTPITSTARPK